jgi:DNA replication protein DnaC
VYGTEQERLQALADRENRMDGKKHLYDGFNCDLCRNKGYVMKVVQVENTWELVQSTCSCEKSRKGIRNLQASGLASLIDDYKFDNFVTSENWQKAILEKAKKFADCEGQNWFFMGGQSGCVDCDTEYFDGTKWVKISQYYGGKVLQYDPVTQNATLVIPQKYIVNDCDKLYQISTIRGSIDMCLSKDHNFAYLTSKGNMQKKPFYEVMEIHKNTTQGFYGRVETAFNFSGCGIDLSENEIRIMCAVIADGSFRKKTKLCYVNIKKERKKERMRSLLSNYKYKEYIKQNGYSTFVFYAPRTEKEFGEYWYNCSNEQLQIICDEIFYWDGYINGKRKLYFSTSKKSADFVQFALSATGIRTTISIDNHKDKTCYVVHCSSGNSTVSMVSSGGRTKAIIQEIPPKDNKEYCFTVSTGYLVLRRNGRIFITGNCGKTHLCTAIAIDLLRKNHEVKYMLWKSDSRKIKNDNFDGGNLIEYYKNVEVLYIDDLFKCGKNFGDEIQKPSGGDINIAFEIINSRVAQKKKTIISSESTLLELFDIDEAIAGRIKQMCGEYCISISRGDGKNYRKRDWI